MMIGRHLYGVRWLYTVGQQFLKNLDMHFIIGKQAMALKVGGPRPCIVLWPVLRDICALRTEADKFRKVVIPLLFICMLEAQWVVQHHSWTGRKYFNFRTLLQKFFYLSCQVPPVGMRLSHLARNQRVVLRPRPFHSELRIISFFVNPFHQITRPLYDFEKLGFIRE